MPSPIVHKYQLGPIVFSSMDGRKEYLNCEECEVQCRTEVWWNDGVRLLLVHEAMCWFCFATKYGQTGNTVTGEYHGDYTRHPRPYGAKLS